MDQAVKTISELGPHALMVLGINIILLVFVRPFLPAHKRKLIPAIAVILGVIFTPLFFSVSIIKFDIPYPIVALWFQGLGYGLAAVGINAWIKQHLPKSLGLSSGDTIVMQRDDLPKEEKGSE